MSYEFSQETRQMILEEPYCAVCGRNANANLSIHHLNGRTSDSVFNASLLCYYDHDKVNMGKEEQLKLIKYTWQVIKKHYPDYKIKQNDLDFFNIIAKKWGITLSKLLQHL